MDNQEKNGTKLCNLAGIRLVHYNPNKTKDIFQKDCSVRAVSRILNITWDEAFTMLSEEALKINTMPNNSKCIYTVLKKYGYEVYKVTKKERPMTVASFIIDHRKGRYIICTNGHIIACINSTIYDAHFRMYDQFISEKCTLVLYQK